MTSPSPLTEVLGDEAGRAGGGWQGDGAVGFGVVRRRGPWGRGLHVSASPLLSQVTGTGQGKHNDTLWRVTHRPTTTAGFVEGCLYGCMHCPMFISPESCTDKQKRMRGKPHSPFLKLYRGRNSAMQDLFYHYMLTITEYLVVKKSSFP